MSGILSKETYSAPTPTKENEMEFTDLKREIGDNDDAERDVDFANGIRVSDEKKISNITEILSSKIPDVPGNDTQSDPVLTEDHRLELTDLTIEIQDKNEDSDTESANEKTAANEEKLNTLRAQVFFWLLMERLVEMMIVIPVTLFGIKWEPLYPRTFLFLTVLSFFALGFSTRALFRIPALTRFPGCFVLKFHHLMFLIVMYFAMAAYFLKTNFTSQFVSPYWAIVAAGTAGASYIYFSIIFISGKVKGQVESSSLLSTELILVLCALVVSQLVYYFAYSNGTYFVFMLNVVGGIFIGFVFSWDNVLIYTKFVNSTKLEEIEKSSRGFFDLPRCIDDFIYVFLYEGNYIRSYSLCCT